MLFAWYVRTNLLLWGYNVSPWAGKMNQILRCDRLPERARWSYLARSGLLPAFRKKNFPESHVINTLLTKLVRSRWLDIGLILFWGRLWSLTLFGMCDSNPWAPRIPVWLHSSVGRASHRYRGGHGFESCWSPDFFRLLSLRNCSELENLLLWSFFTFIYNRSSNMNYFIYTSHQTTRSQSQREITYRASMLAEYRFRKQKYRVAWKFCESFILRIGDVLWFAGTNFCGSRWPQLLVETNFYDSQFK